MTQQQVDYFNSLPDEALVSAADVCSGRSAPPNVLRMNAKALIENWIHAEKTAGWFNVQYPKGGEYERKEFSKKLEQLKYFDVASIKYLALREQTKQSTTKELVVPANVRKLFKQDHPNVPIPKYAEVTTVAAPAPKEKRYRILERQIWTIGGRYSVTVDSEALTKAIREEKTTIKPVVQRAVTRAAST
jgi:hypothetical protein